MPMRVAEERFRKLVFGGAVAGLILHAIFLVAFIAIGAQVLALFNVGSLVLFAYCLRLVRRRREDIAVSLIQFEVLTHAALAVWFLGWQSGFHYYVFCLIPPVVALPRGVAARRAAARRRRPSRTLPVHLRRGLPRP